MTYPYSGDDTAGLIDSAVLPAGGDPRRVEPIDAVLEALLDSIATLRTGDPHILGDPKFEGTPHFVDGAWFDSGEFLFDTSSTIHIDTNAAVIRDGGVLHVEGQIQVEDDGILSIDNGGTAVVRAGGELHFDDGDTSLITGSARMPSGTTITMLDAQIVAGVAGAFIVDDDGFLEVMDGGVANFEDGSLLNIKDGAELHVKSSGFLQLEAGSNADLSGDVSVAGDFTIEQTADARLKTALVASNKGRLTKRQVITPTSSGDYHYTADDTDIILPKGDGTSNQTFNIVLDHPNSIEGDVILVSTIPTRSSFGSNAGVIVYSGSSGGSSIADFTDPSDPTTVTCRFNGTEWKVIDKSGAMGL